MVCFLAEKVRLKSFLPDHTDLAQLIRFIRTVAVCGIQPDKDSVFCVIVTNFRLILSAELDNISYLNLKFILVLYQQEKACINVSCDVYVFAYIKSR